MKRIMLISFLCLYYVSVYSQDSTSDNSFVLVDELVEKFGSDIYYAHRLEFANITDEINKSPELYIPILIDRIAIYDAHPRENTDRRFFILDNLLVHNMGIFPFLTNDDINMVRSIYIEKLDLYLREHRRIDIVSQYLNANIAFLSGEEWSVELLYSPEILYDMFQSRGYSELQIYDDFIVK